MPQASSGYLPIAPGNSLIKIDTKESKSLLTAGLNSQEL